MVGRGIQLLDSKQQSSEKRIESQLHRFADVSGRCLGGVSVYKNLKESELGPLCGNKYDNNTNVHFENHIVVPVRRIPAPLVVHRCWKDFRFKRLSPAPVLFAVRKFMSMRLSLPFLEPDWLPAGWGFWSADRSTAELE